jgi:hypothetical protein
MHQIVGRLPEALGYYRRSKRCGVDRAAVHIKDVSSPADAPQASLLLCDTPASPMIAPSRFWKGWKNSPKGQMKKTRGPSPAREPHSAVLRGLLRGDVQELP